MSYGSLATIEALASTWTKAGHFTDSDPYSGGTIPSLTQVNAWIDQMSLVVDFAIANEGFETPVVNPTAVAAIADEVEKAVADLCHAAHKSGRFFTKKALESGAPSASAYLTTWVGSRITAFRTLKIPTVTNAVGMGSGSFDVL
jgi:hypothetical protein